ncbi:hypothetical protein EDB89DRAFT_771235 [Lactarius sanguifluus]|nr:hypothetical protein EDB89DRAFT_771235 [Lactarius sanguifluus]
MQVFNGVGSAAACKRRNSSACHCCQLRLDALLTPHTMDATRTLRSPVAFSREAFLSKITDQFSGCANIMLLSGPSPTRRWQSSPNPHAPYLVSAPAPSKHGSPPNVVVKNRQQNTFVATWHFPEEIYASTLPSWRAAFRRQCVAVVDSERECETIAQ